MTHPPETELSQTPAAISVRGLGKCFKTYARPTDMFWEIVTGKQRHSEFWALRNLDFEIGKGEVVGVVGRNGAGKSTLLRMITGVLDCSEGSIEIAGKLSAILELGTGFHPDYTGRANIIRGGLVQGMTREEIERKMDSIIEFSGLQDFIDQPFRTYSSGMQARLTFATATAIEPDILIVDEALAAGDAYFVQKSLARIREICRGGATVLLVSHGSAILASICDRVMWIEKGEIKAFGQPLDVVRDYDLSIHTELSEGEGSVELVEADVVDLSDDDGVEENNDEQLATSTPQMKPEQLFGATGQEIPSSQQRSVFRRGPVRIERVEFLDGKGESVRVFGVGDSLTVRVHYSCDGELPDESLGLALALNRQSDLQSVFAISTHTPMNPDDLAEYDTATFRRRPANTGVIEARIDPIQIQPGGYLLSLGLLPNIPTIWAFYEYHHFGYEVRFSANGHTVNGIFNPLLKWSHFPSPVQAEVTTNAA